MQQNNTVKNNNVYVMFPGRKIVFKEQFQERVFLVETEQQLAETCLNILRERYTNPAWGYKPDAETGELNEQEKEFLEFYIEEGRYLPALLKRHADRIFQQLNVSTPAASDVQREWYESVEQLLSLPPNQAVMYKLPFKAKLIPTSYYLLLQREHFPGEGLMFIQG